MLVSELMTTDVVTVPNGVTLAEAVEQLLTHDVGSVVVVADGDPTGIVTETDTLEALQETGRRLDEIPVESMCHRPVVTTAPDRTVQGVARRMADKEVKNVPVMDDLELVGIVTLSDIVWHLSDIRREASALDEAREKWS